MVNLLACSLETDISWELYYISIRIKKIMKYHANCKEAICMKYQNLFYWNNENGITLTTSIRFFFVFFFFLFFVFVFYFVVVVVVFFRENKTWHSM